MLKLRTVKIAYWVFCASKHNRKFQILTFGEILTIRFSNLNRIRIRILFGFGKSCEYEYEYIRFWKIIRIRIRIVFGLKISAEYEYEYHYSVSTIRILFEYRIIRSPLICDTFIMGLNISNAFPYFVLQELCDIGSVKYGSKNLGCWKCNVLLKPGAEAQVVGPISW